MVFRCCLILVIGFTISSSVAAVPEKESLEKTAPEKTVREKAAPEKAVREKKSPGKTATEKAETSKTPATEFARLYRDWKAMVVRLMQIKQRYSTASDMEKKAFEADFEEKMEQVKALDRKLFVAAEKAYLAAPNKDNDQNEYLFAYLTGLVQSDDFDKAARLAAMLVDHGYEHKHFNLLAGVSFFGANEFERAEKHLKLAGESGELNPAGKQDLDLIEKHGYKQLWEKEQAIRAAEEKAHDLPRVKLSTNKGDIVVELFENEAPIATANFISLVEKKYYDGLKFHRVLPGFMAQGGDPKGDGNGGPGYTIPDECFQSNHRNHFRGSLSMAHSSQRDSSGSQFFLTFAPSATLDGQYTVFGRIVEGDDVLAKLQRCQPGDSNTPDRINKAVVLSKRSHKYDFVKRPDKK